jgi:hypothetical protein
MKYLLSTTRQEHAVPIAGCNTNLAGLATLLVVCQCCSATQTPPVSTVEKIVSVPEEREERA